MEQKRTRIRERKEKYSPWQMLASVGVARAQGRSAWRGAHFSQSRPAVLWRQSHCSWPSLSWMQREAWPLHLQRPPMARSEMA